jgi:hypothetical protein
MFQRTAQIQKEDKEGTLFGSEERRSRTEQIDNTHNSLSFVSVTNFLYINVRLPYLNICALFVHLNSKIYKLLELAFLDEIVAHLEEDVRL